MDPILPLEVYGAEVSYFTGKLEAVLRFKELPYDRISRPPGGELEQATGVAQVPAVRLADGRWMTDTTPIVTWLDEQFLEPGVIPRDPVLAFFSRLVEDYADEWLWRPAMGIAARFSIEHQASNLRVGNRQNRVPVSH